MNTNETRIRLFSVNFAENISENPCIFVAEKGFYYDGVII